MTSSGDCSSGKDQSDECKARGDGAVFSSKVWEKARALLFLPYLRAEFASFLGEDGEVA